MSGYHEEKGINALGEVLAGLELGKYQESFAKEGYDDCADLVKLDRKDLSALCLEMGMSDSDSEKLLQALQASVPEEADKGNNVPLVAAGLRRDYEFLAFFIEPEVLHNIRTVEVQEDIDGIKAFYLGLGSDARANSDFRKLLGKPGAPFGGLGFFDPQKALESTPPEGFALPPEATFEFVRKTKLDQFLKCARFEASFYVWAVQPMYDPGDQIIAAEILLRAKNGASVSAPFEDIQALVNPDAPEAQKAVYVEWKAAEIVDFALKALENPGMDNLDHFCANVRPLDLDTESAVFQEVKKRIGGLAPDQKALLTQKVVIEVTEDQKAPTDEGKFLQAWKALGFRLAYDDAIGDLACEALGKKDNNFHRISAFKEVVDHYNFVKVDIDWAGFLLFLSHPSYAFNNQIKEEVLEKAKSEGVVYVPKAGKLESTGVKLIELLEEFATWAKFILKKGKTPMCIELSVTQKDKSHAYVLQILKDKFDLDIFGRDRASFCFQGGPTGAKAFEPQYLAAAMNYKSEHQQRAIV